MICEAVTWCKAKWPSLKWQLQCRIFCPGNGLLFFNHVCRAPNFLNYDPIFGPAIARLVGAQLATITSRFFCDISFEVQKAHSIGAVDGDMSSDIVMGWPRLQIETHCLLQVSKILIMDVRVSPTGLTESCSFDSFSRPADKAAWTATHKRIRPTIRSKKSH